jgi:hypothetical protein
MYSNLYLAMVDECWDKVFFEEMRPEKRGISPSLSKRKPKEPVSTSRATDDQKFHS